MTDSSSAAPSLESLRQQWERDLMTYPTESDERAAAAAACLRLCIKDLQPFVDHERSLVAQRDQVIYRFGEAMRTVKEAEERERSLVAEIQRLTDALKAQKKELAW